MGLLPYIEPAPSDKLWDYPKAPGTRLPPETISVEELGRLLTGLGLDIAAPRREHGNALLAHGDVSLRSLRLAAGLSQQDLAEKTGMDQPNIARLESSGANPQLGTLRKLSQALGVDMNTLEKAFP